MGIAITEEHRELEAVVGAFLDRHSARAASRSLLEADAEPLPQMWGELAEMGWLGMHIPEEFGGSGYGLPELVIVLEEFGGAIAPGPFVTTLITSAVIAALGDTETKARLLPGLVDGSRTAAVGFNGAVRQRAELFTGDAGVVLGAGVADVLMLTAGSDILIVDADTPGISVENGDSLDRTRRSATVTLTEVAGASATILPGGAALAGALARLLVSAEAVGAAHDCLDTALEYAKVREQFGRAIGTFQAVKHHLADMLVATEAARAVVWDAARAAGAASDEFELIAACAATLAIPAYVHNAETQRPPARRDRVHMGARCAPAFATCDHDAVAVRW